MGVSPSGPKNHPQGWFWEANRAKGSIGQGSTSKVDPSKSLKMSDFDQNPPPRMGVVESGRPESSAFGSPSPRLGTKTTQTNSKKSWFGSFSTDLRGTPPWGTPQICRPGDTPLGRGVIGPENHPIRGDFPAQSSEKLDWAGPDPEGSGQKLR